MKYLFLLLCIATICVAQVTKVQQKAENGRIVITYDLQGKVGELYDITVNARNAQGEAIKATATVGDVTHVCSGVEKVIWWEPQLEGLSLDGWTITLTSKFNLVHLSKTILQPFEQKTKMLYDLLDKPFESSVLEGQQYRKLIHQLRITKSEKETQAEFEKRIFDAEQKIGKVYSEEIDKEKNAYDRRLKEIRAELIALLLANYQSTPPPILTAKVLFSEPFGNNTFHANGKGKFTLTVTNSGKGIALEVEARVTTVNTHGISTAGSQIFIGDDIYGGETKLIFGNIPAGETKTSELELFTNNELTNGKCQFSFTFTETRGFPPYPIKIIVDTRAVVQPKSNLLDNGIHKQSCVDKMNVEEHVLTEEDFDVGFLRFNMPYDSVISHLGKPLAIRSNEIETCYVALDYPKIVVWLNSWNRRVCGFDISTSSYGTTRGLRVGDSVRNIEKLYGNRNWIEKQFSLLGPYDYGKHSHSEATIYYKGDKHIVLFTNKQKIVSMLFYVRTTMTDDDFNLGFLKLDTPFDSILTKLGNPDSLVNGDYGTTGYYFPKLLLWRDNSTEKLSAMDVYDSSFITKRGIKIGDSIDKVESLYGHGDELKTIFERLGPYDYKFNDYSKVIIIGGSPYFVLFIKDQKLVKILSYIGVNE